MDEIFALQEQLAAVQQSSTSQRLSDRNIVELVMKLQALNLIELIFTRNGKEYLTHPQLTLEIQDEIQAQGGRVNLIDLPDVLNVDLRHIQEKMSAIIQPDQSIRLVRGEIITSYYLSTLVEELDDALSSSQHGYDDVGTIATRYALPVDLVKEALNSYQDTIDATFDAASGSLRSASSITREYAAACGALRAITTPTLLTDVAKHRGIQPSVIRKVADQLLLNEEVRGVLVGNRSRATFVPDVFSSAAATVIISAFTSNGFVPLERMRKLYLPDINQFVADKLKGAVILKECVAGPVLIETLATSATEAIVNDGWLDVASSLPPDFPNGDVSLVVDRIALGLPEPHTAEISTTEVSRTGKGRKKGKNASRKNQEAAKRSYIFGDRFIASPRICQRCTDIITGDAVTRASERAKAMSERMDIVVSQSISVQTDPGERGLKDMDKKVKGKGRRRATGKDKGTSKMSTMERKGEDPFPVAVPSAEESVDIAMSDHSFSRVLESDYLESSNDGEDLLVHIIERLFESDGLRELYETKAAEAVITLEREQALAKQKLEKDLLTGLEHTQLFFKSAATLPSEDLSEISREWVIDSICVDALCRMVDIVAQNTGVSHPGLRKASWLPMKREKIELIRDVCRKLPPTIEAKIRLFIAIVTGKDNNNTNDFLSLYDENTTLFDFPERRPLDKKGERVASANMRAEMTLSLDGDSELSEMRALRTAVMLAHSKSSGGSIISFPEESTKLFCEAIEQRIKPSEMGSALRELREALSLQSEEDSAEITNSKWSHEFARKMEALREFVG